MEPCRAIVIGIDGGGARGLKTAEVFDATDQGLNGAEDRAARAAEAYKFTSSPVLLGGKF
jgi:hypothetical protein